MCLRSDTRGTRGASNPFTCISRVIQKGGARGIVILDLNRVFLSSTPLSSLSVNVNPCTSYRFFIGTTNFSIQMQPVCQVTRSRVCFRKINDRAPYRRVSRQIDYRVCICGTVPFRSPRCGSPFTGDLGGYLSPMLNAIGETRSVKIYRLK